MTQEIDPRFFIPPNVTGLNYKSETQPTSDVPVQDGEVDAVADYVVSDEVIEDSEAPIEQQDEDRLLPPDYVTIVSQTSRITPGGMVVDVVIDVEDAPRVSQFEVRVTK